MNAQVQAIRNEIDRRLKYTIERLDQSTCEKEREFDFGSRRAYIDLLSFIDSLTESNCPKLSDTLEEAARLYAIPHYMKDIDVNHIEEYPYDTGLEAAFKAGAEWMAGQGVILNLSIDEFSCGAYNACVEQGLTSEDDVIIQVRKV